MTAPVSEWQAWKAAFKELVQSWIKEVTPTAVPFRLDVHLASNAQGEASCWGLIPRPVHALCDRGFMIPPADEERIQLGNSLQAKTRLACSTV